MNSFVVLSDDDTFDNDAVIYQLNGDGEEELEQGGFRFVKDENIVDALSYTMFSLCSIGQWHESRKQSIMLNSNHALFLFCILHCCILLYAICLFICSV